MQPKERLHEKTDWIIVCFYTLALLLMLYFAWEHIPATAAEQAVHAASGKRGSSIPLRVIGWMSAVMACGAFAAIVKEVRKSHS